ncbi:hypothetical protein [Sphingomonas alpina]|uniref:Uncharacterized protein n=1 Tax=Sphingomonas alpina TaxID=653931 RepID=A0A7H0LHU2_9SPHN|nr:hypothetical protein [Sphingomonas alpina]QNQ09245.1 hypothetical protein H3Z74_21665 [Sphingomonas alpina]
MPEGFRSRVNTNVVDVQQRDPRDLVSPIGAGIAALGKALGHVADNEAETAEKVAASEHRIALEEQRRQRSATVANRAAAWAETQAAMAADLDTLRSSSEPGAAGYKEQADQAITDRLTGFLGTLGDDPEVRQRFEPLVAATGATTRLDEDRWARGERTKQEGANIDTWRDTTGNALMSSPTPEKLEQAFTATDLLYDALDVPGTVKGKLKESAKRGFVQNFLDGRMQAGDWQGPKALLDAGQFDAFLDPAQKVNYLKQAGNAQEQQQREVELAQGRAREEARDAGKAVEAKVKAGIVPTPAELRTTRAQLKAAGVDDAELIEFDALNVKVGVNRSYGAMVDQPGGGERIRRDRDALAAKMAAGKASETEQMMKAQLDDLVTVADKNETEQLKGLMGKGPIGKMQALAQLTGTPQARYEKAETLEPGLGAVSLLGPQGRQAAIEGKALRQARPKDFGKAADAERSARGMLGPMMTALGPEYRRVVDTAWDIMASNQAKDGKEGFDEGAMRHAINIAMGATVRPNGALQGGVQRVRGKSVWLPAQMTAPEFDQQLSRTDFSGAVYANGKAVDKADVLASYRPSFVAEGADGRPIYQMVDANGNWLRGKDGSAFVLLPKVR